MATVWVLCRERGAQFLDPHLQGPGHGFGESSGAGCAFFIDHKVDHPPVRLDFYGPAFLGPDIDHRAHRRVDGPAAPGCGVDFGHWLEIAGNLLTPDACGCNFLDIAGAIACFDLEVIPGFFKGFLDVITGRANVSGRDSAILEDDDLDRLGADIDSRGNHGCTSITIMVIGWSFVPDRVRTPSAARTRAWWMVGSPSIFDYKPL